MRLANFREGGRARRSGRRAARLGERRDGKVEEFHRLEAEAARGDDSALLVFTSAGAAGANANAWSSSSCASPLLLISKAAGNRGGGGGQGGGGGCGGGGIWDERVDHPGAMGAEQRALGRGIEGPAFTLWMNHGV